MILLTLACLAALTTLCERKELDEAAPREETAARTDEDGAITPAASANLLYEETMEGSSIFSKAHAIENCGTEWTLKAVTTPVYQGSKAAHIEIRKDQPLVGTAKRVRSEITIIKGTESPNFPSNGNVWYSFALNLPSVGFEYDDTRDCLNQWFEDGSDETTIRAHKDKLFLEVTPPEGSSTLMKYDLYGTSSSGSSIDGFTNIPKDKWHYFVFHFIHSKGSDGLIEVWRDGVKIHTIKGRNMHLELPKWKIGLYKSSFLDKSSKHYSRIMYVDDVRVGNSNATLADMMGGTTVGGTTTGGTTTGTTTTGSTTTGTTTTGSTTIGTTTTGTTTTGTTTTGSTTTPPPTGTTTTGSTTTPPPTTVVPPPTGAITFTLVNSSTEKDIMALTEGAVVNRKTLGVSKFNVRANAGGPVVKFALSGAASKSRVDDKVPYALFGDDNGNYSSWEAPAGKYKLEANTYSGTKDKMGSATGTPVIINFTVQ